VPDDPVEQPATRSIGEAVVRYSLLRLVLFLVVFLPALALIGDLLLAMGAGVLGSALLGVPLLARYRRELNEAAAVRAERRLAEQLQRRARLDGG
jgi:hypothetical protein